MLVSFIIAWLFEKKFKGITHWGAGDTISILTKESFHYVVSRDMTQAAWALHGTCVMYPRLVGKWIMYTDIDFGITHTFQLHSV